MYTHISGGWTGERVHAIATAVGRCSRRCLDSLTEEAKEEEEEKKKKRCLCSTRSYYTLLGDRGVHTVYGNALRLLLSTIYYCVPPSAKATLTPASKFKVPNAHWRDSLAHGQSPANRDDILNFPTDYHHPSRL